MLEGNQFSLWLSTECHYAKFIDQTKSIMHNRNTVTCVTVEVHLNLVCGKALSKASFQIKTLLMTVFLPSSSSVWTTSDKCFCLLIHVLSSPQRLLPTDVWGNAFQGCTAQPFGAALSYGLSSPLAFARLQADGSGGLWQPVSRWQAPGVLSAPACCKAAKQSSSGPVLPWHCEDCSKSGKELIRL